MVNTYAKRQWSPYELNQLSRSGLADLAGKIKTDIPVEYLTGKVDFCGWSIQVSPAVLIPRVETEELVKLAYSSIKKLTRSALQIVEVGTGSGAIGLSLWRELIQKPVSKQINFNLFDISQAALDVANLNLAKLKSEFSASTHLPYPFLGVNDLLETWPKSKKIDVLIANLPYIPTENVKKLPPSVIDFEPLLALDGGSDGLRLIERLLNEAEPLLNLESEILLEIDDSHTLNQFEQLNPRYTYQLIKDSFGNSRFISARLKF